MRVVDVFVNHNHCGQLIEIKANQHYQFKYEKNYTGPAVSLTLPVKKEEFEFAFFPPFFDGLLPEGYQLESLLKREKIDRKDYLTQLIAVGEDLVGNVQIRADS